MTASEIIKKLKKLGSAKNVAGMARFGIITKKAFGVAHPDIDKLAREIGKNHGLAQELWLSQVHDARILAGQIDRPEWVTAKQMDSWTRDFDSWGVCDSTCMHLFSRTTLAHKKVWQYAKSNKEYIRRTSFALMAALAVHDKKAGDSDFIKFFPLIKEYATDERNYVRKAVNWALRQIGKRNFKLNKKAIKLAREIIKIDSRAARWIAADALHELKSEAIKQKLARARKNNEQ
ncbi:DNA alkylation repair protein [Patescibacteria group bacterium]|nr:DNA alkylation repair protein [Patescibacteria group bacterium]MBU2220034.1 DNA alkylation repair protein [Patescibacteria group bacterium]MBU2264876.1 DNA alkylation repair protein [Patescibacteria group bacterium]